MLFHTSMFLGTAIDSLVQFLIILGILGKFLPKTLVVAVYQSPNHDFASKLFFKSVNSSSAASGQVWKKYSYLHD